jgi:hypothetical protein
MSVLAADAMKSDAELATKTAPARIKQAKGAACARSPSHQIVLENCHYLDRSVIKTAGRNLMHEAWPQKLRYFAFARVNLRARRMCKSLQVSNCLAAGFAANSLSPARCPQA